MISTQPRANIMGQHIALFLSLFVVAVTAKASPQNILLIIADDYGVDSSSLYNSTNNGASLPPTPNIVSLAQTGVLFRNAYANPVCSPTRACLLTGQFGFRTGIGDVIDNGSALTTSAFTLPKAFTNAATGHALAQFGKWHLTNGPNTPRNVGGWTNFMGSLQGAVSNYYSWNKTVNGTTSNGYPIYATTDLVNDATNWISARGANPWFAWVAFNAPHTPLHLPPTNLCPHYAALSGTPQNINANPRPYFEAMVEAMDTEIGRLLASVNRSNTHIIFLGDNGTPNNTLQPPFPAGRGKDSLYEGGVHVPLIISGPSVVNSNRANDTLVNAVDLFATILELAGTSVAAAVPTNVTIDSQSVLPVLQNDTTLARHAYLEKFNTNAPSSTDGRVLRNTQFKLIQFHNGHEEFYDLLADPYESINLLNTAFTASQQANYYSLILRLGNCQNALAAPVITSFSFAGDQFSVTVPRATNLSYGLWRASALDELAWSPLTNTIIVTNGTASVTLTDTNAVSPANFYRVRAGMP